MPLDPAQPAADSGATRRLPAVSLLASPGRLAETVALGAELDAAGFAGLYLPSLGDPVSLCLSLAHATRRITLATSVLPIYRRHPTDLAAAACHLAEVSGNRFVLGLGVSHPQQRERLGAQPRSLLEDLRTYLDQLSEALDGAAHPPRLALAGLGPRMIDLALSRSSGLIQANAVLSCAAALTATLRDRRPPGFEVSVMIPTVLGADLDAARERCRDILLPYLARPSYVSYWRRAGHEAVMDKIEAAGDPPGVRAAMTDDWIDDVCLYGPLDRVREGLAAWYDSGIDLPILVPSALDGGHRTALRHVLALAD